MNQTGLEYKRLTLAVTGRVQGVGFRYTTAHVAAGFAVTGFVRNEWDGSVTVVAEGVEAEIRRFHAALRASHVYRGVEGESVQWMPAQGGMPSFSVRHT